MKDIITASTNFFSSVILHLRQFHHKAVTAVIVHWLPVHVCASVLMAQALSVISTIGDMLLVKYSRQPVPVYSENDEDFRQRHANNFSVLALCPKA